MTVILGVARRSRGFAPFATIANTTLVIVGALLFLMQMHSYLHNEYPDDFGFSTTKHIFDHFSNDIPSGDQLDREGPPSGPKK
jgi:hypothetical protein